MCEVREQKGNCYQCHAPYLDAGWLPDAPVVSVSYPSETPSGLHACAEWCCVLPQLLALPLPPSLSLAPPIACPAPHPTPVLMYTHCVCRAKAGGKQSTKDATGKFARSAGSRLRRYNEAALSRDITSLVKEWGALLGRCGRIFVAAPGSNSK